MAVVLLGSYRDCYTDGMNAQENSSPWVVNTTDATFMDDVIERSKQVPVVVDFWATWCQPCRMLGPILEKLAAEYDGKFVLVKADGDHCPSATAQFNVQAYPTVFGLRNGEAVDYFEGVLPEEQLRQWLDRLLPSEAEMLMAEALQIRDTDAASAEAKLRKAMELAPDEIDPALELARTLLTIGHLDAAEETLVQLRDKGFDNQEILQMLASVEVKRSGEQSGGVAACRAACEQSPSDSGLKLSLAEALTAAGEYEEALQLALSAVQADRTQHGERARQIMVGIFNLLPDDSPLTHEYRRQLSTALY